jgi:hypothetical protein
LRKPIVVKKPEIDWLRKAAKDQGVHREDVLTKEQQAERLNQTIMDNEGDALLRFVERQKRRNAK